VSPAPTDRLQGTLDLLILRTLQSEPMHGWGIAQRLLLLSQELFQVNQGSLYPALHRLEDQGWIAAEWGTSENNRKARYYRITAAGRRHLSREREEWNAFVAAVTRVLSDA
jgi:transcriptional regulator